MLVTFLSTNSWTSPTNVSKEGYSELQVDFVSEEPKANESTAVAVKVRVHVLSLSCLLQFSCLNTRYPEPASQNKLRPQFWQPLLLTALTDEKFASFSLGCSFLDDGMIYFPFDFT